MTIRIENGGIEIITDAGIEVKTAQAAEEREQIKPVKAAENTEYLDETGECSQVTYLLKGLIKHFDEMKIGDLVKLPAFTVPAAKMDGENVMKFEEMNIPSDYAVVVDKKRNGDLVLVFDHCLFESAMDLNDETEYEQTQLGQYLNSVFLRAMNDAGIPAEECGLISRYEMFGDDVLEYFKVGRNRIAFDFDEDCSRWCWLSTPYDEDASAARFCYASYRGIAYYSGASIVAACVRPRFIIQKS